VIIGFAHRFFAESNLDAYDMGNRRPETEMGSEIRTTDQAWKSFEAGHTAKTIAVWREIVPL
jgi:hypothetical protein